MDAERFESLLRAITSSRSRRDALRLLTTAVAATVGLAQVHEASALCLENGEPCDPKAVPNGCCSGRCSRRRKRCKAAPSQDTCTVEHDICNDSAAPESSCGATDICVCFVTTRGHSFCSSMNSATPCESDDDCKGVFGGVVAKGARCVQNDGDCNQGGPTSVCAAKCADA